MPQQVGGAYLCNFLIGILSLLNHDVESDDQEPAVQGRPLLLCY